jgi:hypothetical protein
MMINMENTAITNSLFFIGLLAKDYAESVGKG